MISLFSSNLQNECGAALHIFSDYLLLLKWLQTTYGLSKDGNVSPRGTIRPLAAVFFKPQPQHQSHLRPFSAQLLFLLHCRRLVGREERGGKGREKGEWRREGKREEDVEAKVEREEEERKDGEKGKRVRREGLKDYLLTCA